ncbi:hypothetical protein RWE15_17125 [Virgibacillus halophilus]|uniref:Uncharacterized protein n=1 Tax=Tigheibacillus halophilus TaxID=361280 RepID=A0ABU5CB74_9BACI|nr:hypothetical protein [Virgibacillus halophilus]
MRLVGWLVLALVCVVMLLSFYGFVIGSGRKSRKWFSERFSLEMFYTLLIMYSIFIIGFGMIYFILSFQGIILVEDGSLDPVNMIGSLIHSFLFQWCDPDDYRLR